MTTLLLLILLSLPVIYLSRKPLLNYKSHGFYRFFGWEGVIILFAFNYKYWFDKPFSPLQIVSWLILIISLIIVIPGFIQMHKRGKASQNRTGKELYGFEKTTELIDNGIFKYIRHPLYASLIYLTWGILLKHFTFFLLIVAVITTIFFIATMKVEEKENIAFFGDKYLDYMKRSKMFIPLIL